MLKNYIIIAFRKLWKNKVYSGINIIGMAIGLACCLTIGLFIWDELSYDRFHDHGENIYRVVEKQEQAGDVYDVAVTPIPLGDALKKDFAAIEQTCRIGSRSAFFQYGSTVAETSQLLVTDNSFFSLFNFELIYGDAGKTLIKPDEVVFSESMADKILGPGWRNAGSPIGKPIHLNNKPTLILTGIVKDAPTNSHIQFEALRSFNYDELKPDLNNWDNNEVHTYIRLRPDANAAQIGKQVFTYITKVLPKSNITFSLQPL